MSKHVLGKVYYRLPVESCSEYLLVKRQTQDGVEGFLVRRPWWHEANLFWVPADILSDVEVKPRVIYAHSDVKVQAGDEFEWLNNIGCRDGSVLPVGSRIQVLDSTQKTPYGEIGPNSTNWVCKAANGTTVWATLEQCISRGLLRKISGPERK